MSRLVALAVAIVLLSGCAYGRKVDYAHSYPALAAAPVQAVEVQVTDARPYVLSGNKKGTFVGLVRGSYYIPYDVNTRSGQPLANDLQAALIGGFERKGVAVEMADRVYDYTQSGQAALASLLAQPTLMQAFGGKGVIDTAQDEPAQIAPVRKAAAELYIPRFGRDGVY